MQDADGQAIKITPIVEEGGDYENWGWSASHFSTENLSRHSHDHELQDATGSVYFHMDSIMMGVGGFDSWSANVEPEFLVGTGPIRTNIRISPQ